MLLAKVLNAVGRSCITVGTLLLLFVGYQLWGTGLREAQGQDRLGREFEKVLAEARERGPEALASIDPIPDGDPVGIIRIPDIGVEKKIVEGVSVSDLKLGPGHYPETPLPGQQGNASIAGHRTTYGAPFNRIDELKPGDDIFVQTVQGEFHYVVKDTDDTGGNLPPGTEGDGDGHFIVTPDKVEVLEDKGDNRLTLTACHPKLSAAKRIIVVAELAGDREALAAQTGSSAPPSLDDIDGDAASRTPAVLLFVMCGAIWLFAWSFGKLWRRWPAYFAVAPFFFVGLYFFFEEFSRLLPSNF